MINNWLSIDIPQFTIIVIFHTYSLVAKRNIHILYFARCYGWSRPKLCVWDDMPSDETYLFCHSVCGYRLFTFNVRVTIHHISYLGCRGYCRLSTARNGSYSSFELCVWLDIIPDDWNIIDSSHTVSVLIIFVVKALTYMWSEIKSNSFSFCQNLGPFNSIPIRSTGK